MRSPPTSAQQRALDIAAEARQRAELDAAEDRADRLQAANRLREAGPEFYAFAQEFRRTFGEGTRVRYIRWEDGTEWREPCDAGLTAVQPYVPPPKPSSRRKP